MYLRSVCSRGTSHDRRLYQHFRLEQKLKLIYCSISGKASSYLCNSIKSQHFLMVAAGPKQRVLTFYVTNPFLAIIYNKSRSFNLTQFFDGELHNSEGNLCFIVHLSYQRFYLDKTHAINQEVAMITHQIGACKTKKKKSFEFYFSHLMTCSQIGRKRVDGIIL